MHAKQKTDSKFQYININFVSSANANLLFLLVITIDILVFIL